MSQIFTLISLSTYRLDVILLRTPFSSKCWTPSQKAIQIIILFCLHLTSQRHDRPLQYTIHYNKTNHWTEDRYVSKDGYNFWRGWATHNYAGASLTCRRGSNPCSGCLTPVGLRITTLPWDGSLGLARAGGNGWRKVQSVFVPVTGCGDAGACCWTTGPPPEDSRWTAVCETADACWWIPLSWPSASHQNTEISDVSYLTSLPQNNKYTPVSHYYCPSITSLLCSTGTAVVHSTDRWSSSEDIL